MNDIAFPNDLPADEMGDYLRLYLDETGEQLDGLVQALLALESNPANAKQLDEAFRLIHSIKGSSALLGLDRITTLTHHLESHFERLRSGKRTLDTATLNVVLRCIDFLRQCNDHLRRGESLGSAGELLDQVKGLEHATAAQAAAAQGGKQPGADVAAAGSTESSMRASMPLTQLTVYFRAGLPMAEMKAELILARLASLGTVLGSNPPAEMLADSPGLTSIEIELCTHADRRAIEAAGSADGVERIVFGMTTPGGSSGTPTETEGGSVSAKAAGGDSPAGHRGSPSADGARAADVVNDVGDVSGGAFTKQPAADAGATAPVMAETVRVDVSRLDVLLNLTGELVVNRARFVQLVEAMAPLFRKSGLSGHASQIADGLRGTLHAIEVDAAVDSRAITRELAQHVQSLDDDTREWDDCRRTFGELVATVDQLSRVSQSLQRGVLSTRMVPVGPLLGRFKRSVRDIANELGKKVVLELVGEKTELDKRMIDEIGDPLNHLIRNAIDHGIEPGDVRIRRGKPEVATVRLSASHRGNNVFITVEDDGAGIDVGRVREIAVARGLVSEQQAAQLGEHEVIELIWQPGFSTAATVSDISGRGVGMDIVRTKIGALNGSIDVASVRGAGTTFTIRLPLTLTITRCMLFQLPQAVFAAPIENVREIVRLADHRVVSANGRQFCDVRGEFLPLIGIDDLFAWQGRERGAEAADNVVILHSGGQSFGLQVNMLLGGQDIVVKPLDENYTHIRGLGGASILGDGSVCLLLDVATCVGLASPTKAERPALAEAVALASAAPPVPSPSHPVKNRGL